jgi:hypothetical protein
MLLKVTTSRSQILRDGGGSNHFGDNKNVNHIRTTMHMFEIKKEMYENATKF